MNELKIIKEQEVLGKQFKFYGDIDSPLFLAKDVAEWIEHSNTSSMLNSVDDAEKQMIQIGTLNNAYSAWFLTEDGLYEVLMQSRKPIAKQFKKEVKEILRTVRKHGLYAVDQLLNDPDFMIKAFTALKAEREQNKQLTAQIETDKPKIIFADAVSASKTTILIGELAKLLKQNGVETGQKRLFAWMREAGYLIKRHGSDWNMPTQKSMESELFEIKETAISHSDGHTSISKTVKVTGKGQLYFINLFSTEAYGGVIQTDNEVS